MDCEDYGKLYIVWKDKWKGRNVYRVDGDINFEDGRVVFKKEDGGIVRVEFERVIRIAVTTPIDMDEIAKLKK